MKKRGYKRREINVEEHFADLLRGVLREWEGERKLALALDASTLSNRFDVLSISVLARGGAIRVAWKMLSHRQEGSWRPHWERLLSLLQEGVPAAWQVVVMADRGLYAAWLFEAIVARGWHPLVRVNGSMGFRPTGSESFGRIEELAGKADSRWKGTGEWSESGERVQGTLAIDWENGYEEAIAVVTDLFPAQVQAGWYQMRFWIETEYKDGKRGWFHWEHSKMIHPQRASRLWLLLALALQHAILLGSVLEARQEEERADQAGQQGSKRQRPAKPQQRQRGREQSVLMRGMMGLRAAACGARESLPQGHLCVQPWPEQLVPVSKPSKSYQGKRKRAQERQRYRQRKRARAREARQEAKRLRQQEKQAQAEARQAARLARRQEQLAEARQSVGVDSSRHRCRTGQPWATNRRGKENGLLSSRDRRSWPKQARPCLLRPNELADLLGPLLFSGWSMGGSFRLTASFLRKQGARLLRDPHQERVPEKNYP